MKKLILPLCFSIFLALVTVAQECEPATAFERLDINEVSVGIMNGGDFWWDLSNAQYEAPKGSGNNSMFAGALWMGGLDTLGVLHAAAQNYRQNGIDHWPGPLNQQGISEEGWCSDFDFIARVNKAEIDQFLSDPGLGMPDAIRNWPARGNPNMELPDQNLAPFVDTNGDGFYDPAQGDYPEIMGEQSLWWVFNDAAGNHGLTGSPALEVEVQMEAFAFTEGLLNHSTFYHAKVINKSANDYKDFAIGVFCDVDLGRYDDDYLGCIPELDLGFGYNGGSFDSVYGVNIPMVGVQIIEDQQHENGLQGLASFTTYDNENSDFGRPLEGQHFYNYLTGKWRNGQAFVNDGLDGRSENGEPYPFLFPDNPSDPDGWSECSVGNTPSDRRFIVSAPTQDLDRGEVLHLYFAVHWLEDVEYPCPDNSLFEAVAFVAEEKVNQLIAADMAVASEQLEASEPQVFPNPATQEITFMAQNAGVVRLYNSTGMLLLEQSMSCHQCKLDVSHLPSGMYWLDWLAADGKKWMTKVMH